ncbi:MAG: ATP-binding protein [Candidatus Micrarchaeaceae archaeon]
MSMVSETCRILYILKQRKVSINGDFYFVWKKLFFKKYLKLTDRINPHIAITGQSGSGKSNAANAIINELSKHGFNFIIIDPKNDYINIANKTSAKIYNARYDGINIFERGNVSINDKTAELSDLFQRHLKLGHVQRNYLYRCIKYTYEISEIKNIEATFSSLLFTINVFKKNAEIKGKKTEVNMLEYLKSRLIVLENLDRKNKLKLSELMNSKSIVTLAELNTADSQVIFMEGLLRQIYSYAISLENEKLKTYVLVDEAGKLGDNPILGRLVSEGRKYGIGIIAITQSAKSLDKDVRSNASLFFCFYTREPEELNYVSNYISGGSDGERLLKIKSAFRKLRIGEAVAVDYSTVDPIIVKFKKIDKEVEPLEYLIEEFLRIPKKDDEIFCYFKQKGFGLFEIKKSLENFESIGKIKSFNMELDSEYRGVWYSECTKNTPEHDITIHIIKKHLEKLEFKPLIYNKAYGPDLSLETSNKKIAIEYETGLKNLNESIKMFEERLKLFDDVIVICNEKKLLVYNQIKNKNIHVFGVNSFLKSDNFIKNI